MPTSGLVITLSADPDRAAAARRRIEADPRFELGPIASGAMGTTGASGTSAACPRYPVVLEAVTGEACEDAVRELQAAPGVELVDIISVDISDLATPSFSTDPSHLEDRP